MRYYIFLLAMAAAFTLGFLSGCVEEPRQYVVHGWVRVGPPRWVGRSICYPEARFERVRWTCYR
jgi:hypothetical protein